MSARRLALDLSFAAYVALLAGAAVSFVPPLADVPVLNAGAAVAAFLVTFPAARSASSLPALLDRPAGLG
ncbi:hypothetical protein BRC81_00665 [Halobacteriales archaeon QS_1_68_20]|nr:MAG: hypothetical protein BRC81_00665 [Halobacteriales archaeon QS_1_68_20]